MDSHNMESVEVERAEEAANSLDLALSIPFPLEEEEDEEEEKGAYNEGAVAFNGSPPSLGRIDPLPACMVFFQVHLQHLCSHLAHLGSWPPPPVNSILVPPNFPLAELPNLLLAQQQPKQHQPTMLMQAPIYSGQPAPMCDVQGPIVFNGPPPPPPRVNPSHHPLQTNNKQSHFQGNQQAPNSFQPNKQTTFENQNQVLRPKFFPSRKDPGKPRPLRRNMNIEQNFQDQMNENLPPSTDDTRVFQASDILQARFWRNLELKINLLTAF